MLGPLLALLLVTTSHSLTCRDQTGQPVQWFTVFKMPGGTDFLYADVNTPTLAASNSDLNNLNNAVSRTLAPIYKSNGTRGINYLMYNDEVPDGKVSNNRGHTKGIVMFDAESLVWLIHSTPNFPNQRASGYAFPSGGTKYGQSFLCISMSIAELPKVARQLLYSWPCIYEYEVSNTFRNNYEDLDLALQGKHIKSEPWSNIEYLKTVGTDYTIIPSFAKFNDFQADIYNDLISPHFEVSLYTETWQNGPGRLGSNCSDGTFVKNIVSMDLLGNQYTETRDHSKWAVSEDSANAMLCIGGINRMSSQFHRAGASFCLHSPKLWTVFRSSIIEYEEC